MSMIKRWLVRLGAWLVYTCSDGLIKKTPSLPELARILTARQDANWPDRDGECKRAAVYAQLVNTFPDINKRVISRAIEDAL